MNDRTQRIFVAVLAGCFFTVGLAFGQSDALSGRLISAYVPAGEKSFSLATGQIPETDLKASLEAALKYYGEGARSKARIEYVLNADQPESNIRVKQLDVLTLAQELGLESSQVVFHFVGKAVAQKQALKANEELRGWMLEHGRAIGPQTSEAVARMQEENTKIADDWKLSRVQSRMNTLAYVFPASKGLGSAFYIVEGAGRLGWALVWGALDFSFQFINNRYNSAINAFKVQRKTFLSNTVVGAFYNKSKLAKTFGFNLGYFYLPRVMLFSLLNRLSNPHLPVDPIVWSDLVATGILKVGSDSLFSIAMQDFQGRGVVNGATHKALLWAWGVWGLAQVMTASTDPNLALAMSIGSFTAAAVGKVAAGLIPSRNRSFVLLDGELTGKQVKAQKQYFALTGAAELEDIKTTQIENQLSAVDREAGLAGRVAAAFKGFANSFGDACSNLRQRVLAK